MEMLTSLQNPRIREWSKLGDRRARLAAGCFLVEGIRLVGEAIVSGAPILELLADESGMPSLLPMLTSRSELEPILVTPEILARLSDTKAPQGVAAIVRLPETAYGRGDVAFPFLAGNPAKRGRRILALERVQDPGNVGTMLRSADACGFDAVLLSSDSADPWQPKVVRSTMGSLWHLDLFVSACLTESARAAQAAGLRVLAAHPRQAHPAWDTDLREGFLLVIGNEANGLSETMLSLADQAVMIPMKGRAESLNAAAAASMLLYESLRQQNGPLQ